MFESGEMYLETIYLLKQTKQSVRSIDIVEELGYSKSSVSRGVNLLKSEGYIIIDDNGNIQLTEIGKELSYEIYERHQVLKDFFVSLGVSDDVADSDACRIEHVISKETFDAIKNR